jgi:hypothetical protein
MVAGKAMGKLAALAAVIGGAIFFWRKTHPEEDTTTAKPTFAPAADKPGAP